MHRVIELESGLRFAQLSKIEYDNKKYLFAVSLTDKPVFLFLQPGSEKKEVVPVKDDALILKLVEILRLQLLNNAE